VGARDCKKGERKRRENQLVQEMIGGFSKPKRRGKKEFVGGSTLYRQEELGGFFMKGRKERSLPGESSNENAYAGLGDPIGCGLVLGERSLKGGRTLLPKGKSTSPWRGKKKQGGVVTIRCWAIMGGKGSPIAARETGNRREGAE